MLAASPVALAGESIDSNANVAVVAAATDVQVGAVTAPAAATPAPAGTVVDSPARASGHHKSVDEIASGKGFIYYPSTSPSGKFRLGLGATYDAIDPQVMYGFSLRFPQVAVDAHYSLGDGFKLIGHFNSMFVTNELLVGAQYSWRSAKWAFSVAGSVGVYYGKLGGFGFDAAYIAPEYRPEFSVGYDLGTIALTFRGSLILMGPEQARVGDTWGGFDNASLFTGHSETLYVENTTQSGSVWYFGAGLMTTRATYALWLLFPDSPALYTYPRVVVGYEF